MIDIDYMEQMQQICSLKAQLESSASDIGDWKVNKYLEYALVGLEVPSNSLLILHDKRQAVRNQIDALQKNFEK